MKIRTKSLYRVDSRFGRDKIERLPIVRETATLIVIDEGHYVHRLDKRSEYQMKDVFRGPHDALIELQRRKRNRLLNDLKRARQEVVRRKVELQKAARDLAKAELAWSRVK
jgi:nucleoside-triphosphatase THEP1